MLFPQIIYQKALDCYSGIWSKVKNETEVSIIRKLVTDKTPTTDYLYDGGDRIFSVCGGTGGYWLRAFDEQVTSRKYKLHRVSEKIQIPLCALLNSSLFYLFWRKVSNGRDLNIKDLALFRFDMNGAYIEELQEKGENHLKKLKATQEYRQGKMAYEQYRPANAKLAADEIDKVLAKHYGFTEEELDFIINYDIKYRMGREG